MGNSLTRLYSESKDSHMCPIACGETNLMKLRRTSEFYRDEQSVIANPLRF
jgi:hypothetical protein